jgi:hypothetical protein
MIKPQTGGTSTTYVWTNNKTYGTETLSRESPTIVNPNGDGKNYIYTEVLLDNLGAVDGDVELTLQGSTVVGESVYGGGDASAVVGTDHTVTVTLKDDTQVGGNVFGGGNKGVVEGKAMVNIED